GTSDVAVTREEEDGRVALLADCRDGARRSSGNNSFHGNVAAGGSCGSAWSGSRGAWARSSREDLWPNNDRSPSPQRGNFAAPGAGPFAGVPSIRSVIV